jgi:hypothetical protein
MCGSAVDARGAARQADAQNGDRKADPRENPEVEKSLILRITLPDEIPIINRDCRRRGFRCAGAPCLLRPPKSDFLRLKREKHTRILINRGFFEKHHCFFLEYPQNESSLFAVFR